MAQQYVVALASGKTTAMFAATWDHLQPQAVMIHDWQHQFQCQPSATFALMLLSVAGSMLKTWWAQQLLANEMCSAQPGSSLANVLQLKRGHIWDEQPKAMLCHEWLPRHLCVAPFNVRSDDRQL